MEIQGSRVRAAAWHFPGPRAQALPVRLKQPQWQLLTSSCLNGEPVGICAVVQTVLRNSLPSHRCATDGRSDSHSTAAAGKQRPWGHGAWTSKLAQACSTHTNRRESGVGETGLDDVLQGEALSFQVPRHQRCSRCRYLHPPDQYCKSTCPIVELHSGAMRRSHTMYWE